MDIHIYLQCYNDNIFLCDNKTNFLNGPIMFNPIIHIQT